MQTHTLLHHPGLLLLPNAKTALMRSPRIALKIKGPPRSPVRRTAAGIKLGRGAALPVVAAAPGGLTVLRGLASLLKSQRVLVFLLFIKKSHSDY